MSFLKTLSLCCEWSRVRFPARPHVLLLSCPPGYRFSCQDTGGREGGGMLWSFYCSWSVVEVLFLTDGRRDESERVVGRACK